MLISDLKFKLFLIFNTVGYICCYLYNSIETHFVSQFMIDRKLNHLVFVTSEKEEIPKRVRTTLYQNIMWPVTFFELQSFKNGSNVIQANSQSLLLIKMEGKDVKFWKQLEKLKLLILHNCLLITEDLQILQESELIYFPINNKANIALFNNQNNENGSVEIFDVYHARRHLQLHVSQIGSWKETKGFEWDGLESITRRKNLTGVHLRCVTLQQAPFMILSDGSAGEHVTLRGGYVKDIFENLQEEFNFTYTCRKPRDIEFGSFRNGQWTGLVRDLVDGWADIIVTSLDITNLRKQAVGHLTPLRIIGSRMVIKKPGLLTKESENFTSELNSDSWLATIFLILTAPLLLTFITQKSPGEKTKIQIGESYLLTLGALSYQGSSLSVNSTSGRIAFITIFLGNLLVYSYYTGALVALLTVTSESTSDFHTLEGMLKDGTYEFGIIKGTALEDNFRESKISPYKEIWEKMLKPKLHLLPTNRKNGVIYARDSKYVFMITKQTFESQFNGWCDVIMMKNDYFRMGTGLALAKESPYKKMFDAHLLKLRNSGILERFWKKWEPPRSLCENSALTSLSLKQISAAFVVFTVGIILSVLICLPAERVAKMRKMNDISTESSEVMLLDYTKKEPRVYAKRF